MGARLAGWILVGAAALAGCGEATGPDGDGLRELPSVLSHYGEVVEVERPASARVGEPFEITVRTFGGGCIRRGRTDVEVDGLVARITPYDSFPAPRSDMACTDELAYLEHVAEVRFDEAGTATVRIRGRSEPSGHDVLFVVWIPVSADL